MDESSRRTNSGAGRRSLPPAGPKFRRLPNRSGHQLFPEHLYELLAQNRISPHRAAVLSYITSLLLRTLPQIDTDTAAGIVYRAKPVPINVPVPDENAGTVQDSVLGSGSDSGAAEGMETKGKMETQAEPEAAARSGSANAWDPSIPEPDPSKKPSYVVECWRGAEWLQSPLTLRQATGRG